jgi:diguanylate cyclase (GGDEF)-like protein/PAS domain S-box-containing protein
MDRYRNLNEADLVRRLEKAEASQAASTSDEAQQDGTQQDETQQDRTQQSAQELHPNKLEIQNQDLPAAQAALEAARDDYAELYDFAPVGYLSLDRNGLIHKLNLTAAKLLGRERASLLHKPFTKHLTKESSHRLLDHLRAAFAQSATISDEFVLSADGDRPAREIRIHSRPHMNPEGEPRCLTTVTETSDTKQLERKLRASREELLTLLAAVPVGICIVEKHQFRTLNPLFPEMLGYTEQELLGEHARTVFPGGDEYQRVTRSTATRAAAGEISEVETVMRRKDGRLLDVLLRAAPIKTTTSSADTIFTALDISDQKQTARTLAETQLSLELALEGGDIGIYSAELPSGQMSTEVRYLNMLGYVPGDLELDWATWLSMIHPEDRPAVELLLQALSRGELDQFEAEYRVRHRLGYWAWVLDRARVFDRDPSDNSLRMAGTRIDVTRRREAERQVMRLVEHDELTGLLNRRGVLRSIQRIHTSAARSGQPYCLSILDLDHFKQINDAYGHAVGDEVLRRVARGLTKDLRQKDWVGRWGGEEFVVVLPETTETQALNTVERLRTGIGKQRIRTHGFELGITLSAGLALCQAPADNPDDILALADSALYAAKAAGRNRTIFYGDKLAQQAISIAALIQEALRSAGVQPAYQNIVELESQRVMGTEAFARIVGQDCRILHARSFLQIAEQLRLMHKIDRLLIQSVLEQMAKQGSQGDRSQLFFINVSGDLLRHSDIVEELAEALETNPAISNRARSLVLKLTEQQIQTETEEIATTLAPLLDLGCRLAIGDCGSDASSYRFMTDLPVDFLELDATLIRLANKSPRALAILKAIVNAAHEIGQTTIAKQVEDQATLERLLKIGVDWGQGYLFGRPTEPTASDALEQDASATSASS